MRVEAEVTIQRRREEVWRLFDDPDERARWQPGLRRHDPLSGERGEPGSRSRVSIAEGGRVHVVQETIRERRPPQLLAGTWEEGSTRNDVEVHFEALGSETTRVRVRADVRAGGALRLLGPLLRLGVALRLRQDLERLKRCAETEP